MKVGTKKRNKNYVAKSQYGHILLISMSTRGTINKVCFYHPDSLWMAMCISLVNTMVFVQIHSKFQNTDEPFPIGTNYSLDSCVFQITKTHKLTQKRRRGWGHNKSMHNPKMARCMRIINYVVL